MERINKTNTQNKMKNFEINISANTDGFVKATTEASNATHRLTMEINKLEDPIKKLVKALDALKELSIEVEIKEAGLKWWEFWKRQ